GMATATEGRGTESTEKTETESTKRTAHKRRNGVTEAKRRRERQGLASTHGARPAREAGHADEGRHRKCRPARSYGLHLRAASFVSMTAGYASRRSRSCCVASSPFFLRFFVAPFVIRCL